MHDVNPERVRSALQFLDPNNRDVWVKMAFAIKSEMGDEGFDIWADWGSAHTRPAGEVKSTWKSAKSSGKIGLGSLIYDAKQAGWKDDTKYEKPSPEVIAQREAKAAARRAQEEAEEAQQQEAAANLSLSLWNESEACTTHDYLTRKGVQSHGLRYGPFEFERTDPESGEVTTKRMKALLVPLYDRQKKLWSLQAISQKAGGPKLLLAGSKKSGNFFPFGKPLEVNGRRVFILGEGYATCASIYEDTGHMVLMCVDASNLVNVATSIRERDANAIIIIAGDNDIWNRKADGTPHNPGRVAAEKAAKAVDGIVALPPFTEADATGADGKGNPTGPKDFNDLYALRGPYSVQEVIEAAIYSTPTTPTPPTPTPPAPPEVPEASAEESEAYAPADDDEPAYEPERALPIDPLGDDADAIDSTGYFNVLGYDRGTFFVFIHEQSQISHFRPGELTDNNLLMMAPLDFWELYFPGSGKDGGFNRKKVLDWFFRLAARRGIFDSARVRGRGAWDDEGRVVYHQGSALYIDGVRTDVTKANSRYVYELAKSEAVPGKSALTDAEGLVLLNTAKLFRWSRPGAAALLAGWTFLAPVCGAMKWRPHIWLTGGAGSGKSTILNSYVSICLGDAKVFANGNSSESGIRQKLKADALPVLFDESEQNDEAEKRRMAPILALIRQASTESVAQTYKGTISGESMNFHIRSMFCLASIQVGIENKADQDRLTKLSLLKPADDDQDSTTWAKIKEALYLLGRDRSMPGRLLRRAIDMLPVIQQNVTVFVDVAARHFGTQRMGDQYGTMLAGAWSLTNSKVATEADAQAMIDAYSWDEFIDGVEVDDSDKALQAILEAKLSYKGDHISIGSVILVASGRSVGGLTLEPDVAARILQETGMKIMDKSLVFRNNSTALKALVSGTRFETDLKGQLLRIKGASVTKKSVRFGAGGNVQRGVAVPLAPILGEDEPPI